MILKLPLSIILAKVISRYLIIVYWINVSYLKEIGLRGSIFDRVL